LGHASENPGTLNGFQTISSEECNPTGLFPFATYTQVSLGD